jgi:hypothetical protein
MIDIAKRRQSFYPGGVHMGESSFNFKDKDDSFDAKNIKNNQNVSPNEYGTERVEIDDRKKRLSHFFPLSGNWKDCAGYGIDGVFKIYSSFLEKKGILMSGPTLFAPMISEINKFA